jgi:hypothetical protein
MPIQHRRAAVLSYSHIQEDLILLINQFLKTCSCSPLSYFSNLLLPLFTLEVSKLERLCLLNISVLHLFDDVRYIVAY